MIDYRRMRARDRMTELQHTADDIRLARTFREDRKAATGPAPTSPTDDLRRTAPPRPVGPRGRRNPCPDDLAAGRSAV